MIIYSRSILIQAAFWLRSFAFSAKLIFGMFLFEKGSVEGKKKKKKLLNY